MNIYVSNLSFAVKDEDLRDFFAEYGEVASAKVIMDKFTNRSRGFAFVEMPDEAAGQKAIQELDGATVDGRSIKVNVARPKEKPVITGPFQIIAGKVIKGVLETPFALELNSELKTWFMTLEEMYVLLESRTYYEKGGTRKFSFGNSSIHIDRRALIPFSIYKENESFILYPDTAIAEEKELRIEIGNTPAESILLYGRTSGEKLLTLES